jgi:hypothetical protein
VRLTRTPTVLHHMIILSLLLPIDAERPAVERPATTGARMK